jgi:hypothetical protein
MSEDRKLTGKVAMVFGGSRGIGAAAARRLAREGANVGLTYVSAPDKAADTVRAIEEEGRTGFAIKADSADPTADPRRSFRTEVSVAGKRNFQGGDKEAETTLEIQGCRRRDKISIGKPAGSGLIAGFWEISIRTRMRGGRGSYAIPLVSPIVETKVRAKSPY